MTTTKSGVSALIALIAALLLSFSTTHSIAQQYPTKPVRVVLAGAAGSLSDTLFRLVFSKLSEGLGQPFVIENIAGAAGVIAAQAVAKASADGYTLLATVNSVMTVNPFLYEKAGYDPISNFESVAMLAQISEVLIANPTLGAKTLEDLVRLAKASPEKITYSSAGNGHVQHLFMELFQRKAGVALVHVPYKGVVPGLQAVVAGEVGIVNVGLGLARPHIASGKVVALAQTNYIAKDALPGVPAITATYPDVDATGWIAVFAPKGVPKGVVAKLNGEIGKTMALPDIRARLVTIELTATAGAPSDLDRTLRADLMVNRDLVKSIGLKID